MSGMLHEISKGCIALECGIAALYKRFAGMFPEAEDFWKNLAMEEENHAAILTIAAEYERRGKLPAFMISCPSSHIRETLALLNAVRRRGDGEDIPLKTALEIALQLEAATREYHVIQVMAKETHSVILTGLQGLAIDNEWHVQKIDSFLRSRF